MPAALPRSSRPLAVVAPSPRVVALAGGTGAAKFLRGLIRVVDPARITVVVNTADDVQRHGLQVSPDIDSVVYGLADIHDEERGWGLRDESWQALAMLERLGDETWFQLGDRDLGTHIWRTARRRAGMPLSAVTAEQCRALGVRSRVVPMSDEPVTTRVRCRGIGELHFQEYFVRERCLPVIEAIRFAGADRARPAPGVLEAIAEADAVVVCPSNPVISIGPILAVPGIREALRSVPQSIAVTPVVNGRALKGPTVAMLEHAGIEPGPAGVGSLYADFCSAMVVDRRDATAVPAVEALGMRAVLADTLMDRLEAAVALATVVRDALGLDDHEEAGLPACAEGGCAR
ncbi:MAG TPA: 2-phospho-L-lactate transferase [Candidatus Dormibacteraeota bacterium]|nr:2-phospho-L-lactate transferase [Candidatus Dormibacteraeota bacterium]